MILLAHCLDIDADLYMLTGLKNSLRIIYKSAVSDDVYRSVYRSGCEEGVLLKALLGYHCFTGCDSISAFSGRGKIKPLSIMGKDEEYVTTMASLGANETISNAAVHVLERFLCHMYWKAWAEHEAADINQLRYTIYCQRGGKIELLLPCRNVLKQHIICANYQEFIWHKSLEPFMRQHSPEGHGWCLIEEKLDVLWMTCNPAPDEVY